MELERRHEPLHFDDPAIIERAGAIRDEAGLLALSEQEAQAVFSDGTPPTTDGMRYWRVIAGGKQHVWQDADGRTHLLTFAEDYTYAGGETLGDYGYTYVRLVSREEAVEGALTWLTRREETIAAALAADEAAGDEVGPGLFYLRGSAADPVVLTGDGAAIFGHHVRAMVESGAADYVPFSDQPQ